jgi:hypothetical protein
MTARLVSSSIFLIHVVKSVKQMSLDSYMLSQIQYQDKNGTAHKLHYDFWKPNGRFCDTLGKISPTKVRHTYMLAGLLSPESDDPRTLLRSIYQNIILLNAFLSPYATSSPSIQRFTNERTTVNDDIPIIVKRKPKKK